MTHTSRHEPFLGRAARGGDWAELARGTYRVIIDAVEAGEWSVVVDVLPVAVLEAEELHEVFGDWPDQIVEWMIASGADPVVVAEGEEHLQQLLGSGGRAEWEARWAQYVRQTDLALALAMDRSPDTLGAVLGARDTWLAPHDRAVDLIYGLLDLAVRLLGEDCLPVVWNHLMSDWYDDHARRLDVANQPWDESFRQLALAITDGFHGHLSGVDRLGDMEFIDESDRIGFRFAPCGSGGRTLRDDTTHDQPRPESPYGFAVTSEPHDWSFGKTGVCAYCVHCCLLNMTMPIDRLGYPTRVIEPPTWPEARDGGTCTWWVYRDPSLVPDHVYEQVGRSRPAAVDPEESA